MSNPSEPIPSGITVALPSGRTIEDPFSPDPQDSMLVERRYVTRASSPPTLVHPDNTGREAIVNVEEYMSALGEDIRNNSMGIYLKQKANLDKLDPRPTWRKALSKLYWYLKFKFFLARRRLEEMFGPPRLTK